MMKIKKIRRAFSLMEVLIASTIFALIMVIAAGVLAQNSGYDARLTKMRETSEGSRRIADLLTREIRAANDPITIDKNLLWIDGSSNCDSPSTDTITISSGLALLDYNNEFTLNKYCLGYGHLININTLNGHYNNRVLIVSLKDSYHIYLSAKQDSTSENYLYYKSFTKPSTITLSIIHSMRNDSNIISNPDYSTVVGFGGFTPNDFEYPIPVGQPIVKFLITVQTKDYKHNDLSTPRIHSGEQAVIQSQVTGRKY